MWLRTPRWLTLAEGPLPEHEGIRPQHRCGRIFRGFHILASFPYFLPYIFLTLLGTLLSCSSFCFLLRTHWSAFLLSEGEAQTTVAIHLRHLRAILNEARRQGMIREAQYPFGKDRYEIQKGEDRKMALTLEQIGQIARYDDGRQTTARYRDYWLFLYLCNGINVADFVRLRYRDIVNGEICFIRSKTEHTLRTLRDIRVVLTPPMQEIIDRWGNPKRPDAFIFPILTGREDAMTTKNRTKDLTHSINKHMKAVGEQLGIGPISTYTARHSFATVLKRAGANIAYISESLGHSDLKTTENYLASFEREEREKNAEILTEF